MTTVAAPRPDTAAVARWFHALADETRVQIVEMLSHKERCVCELEQVLDVAQSKLSFHLKVLKDAGLLADRKEGRWMYYNLQRETLDQIAAYTKSVKPGKHAGSCTLACCD
ncbi:MAG TPA: metalloregulator ArsR/SmtB family transcription factor [Gemmatimonadales bacterium]|jgi:ArsR family transcriptional regulator, arsenate/arsenite/antimonite-responsive transcriptional repressor|nr:metalloregulator ArsR/SmtB family transcription factor [Gemmatimonadales bacterium]